MLLHYRELITLSDILYYVISQLLQYGWHLLSSPGEEFAWLRRGLNGTRRQV